MKNMHTEQQQHLKGYLLVVISTLMWGTLPVFSKLSYQLGSDGLTSAAMRSYLAATMTLICLLATDSLKQLKRREIPFYLLYGIVAGGGTFVCYMTAIERLSTAMAAILLYTGPAFVIMFNRLLYGERITRVKLISIICTFVGCLLVVRGYEPTALSANFEGILIGLASGICYSMTTVMGKKAKSFHEGRFNASMMIVMGSLVFLLVKPPWTIPAPSPSLWLCFIGLAVFGTVLGYMLYLKGFDYISDGGVVSILATLEPIVGTLLGILIFHDKLEIPQVLGIVIVVAGICAPVAADLRPLYKANEKEIYEK